MVTFIIPTRNNLPYLKLAYASIRKHYPQYEIIILDDGSTDGTKEWIDSESGKQDSNTLYVPHDGRQVGHTVLYDKGVELADNDIFTIFHADMVCGPNYVENLKKHLNHKGVVAATRIEPPLHPEGKEKIVKNFGIYTNDFNESEFQAYCKQMQKNLGGIISKGIFAPWMMYKEDFLAIGGHDKLFSPFPYEDSDIFQRFILAGYDVKQSRDAFVYHFTCRGHRWTEQVQKDDLFYKLCCAKNSSHFIRKWGNWIENDENSYPVINNKYDIGLVAKSCPQNLLGILEPWCSTIYTDANVDQFISQIQPGTPFDLSKRVKKLNEVGSHDILVTFDAMKLTTENVHTIMNLPKMLADSGDVGTMEFDIFTLEIKDLATKQKNLVNNNEYYKNQLLPIGQNDPYLTDELFRVFERVKKNP